jgi:hypothetical protein
VATQFYSAVALALLISIPLGEIDLRMYRAIKTRVDSSQGALPWVLSALYLAAFVWFTALAVQQLG